MTLSEIQEQIMFQTNNDADDLGDYTPHINDYINQYGTQKIKQNVDEFSEQLMAKRILNIYCSA